MRFKRWPRHPFTDTPRKRAALRRKQIREQEALPLLSTLVRENQASEDEVMTARAEAWKRSEERDRKRRADNWRKARRRLQSLTANERSVLTHAWNSAPYPADPVYLLDFLHAYNVGRFSLDALPFSPCPSDPLGRQSDTHPARQKGPHTHD